ncbi:oligosaccharide flippase family protein [Kushneria sp. AK178]
MLISTKNELLLSLAKTFAARGIAALGGLILGVLLARLYGPSGVGVFALAQSIVLGSSIVTRYGMDESLIRFIGKDPTGVHCRAYFKFALIKVLVWSSLFAITLFLFREKISFLFSGAELVSILPFFCLSIPAFTSAYLFAGLMKGMGKPASSCFLENGFVSLICAIIVTVVHFLPIEDGLWEASIAFVAASWITMLIGFLMARSLPWNNLNVSLKKEQRKEFGKVSGSFFILRFSTFINTVVSVLIAAYFLDNAGIGIYRNVERIAVLISFSLIVINAVFPPRFAKLYYEGNYSSLEKLAKYSAFIGFITTAPISLLCMIRPDLVLSIFGEQFENGALALRLLAIGHLINVSTGSVGYLLNMTGNEKVMKNIALVCSLIGLIMIVLLTPIMGFNGTAVGAMSTLIIQNVVTLFFVRRNLGIWPIPLISKKMLSK